MPWLTLGAARSMQLEGTAIGSFASGAEADFVVLDPRRRRCWRAARDTPGTSKNCCLRWRCWATTAPWLPLIRRGAWCIAARDARGAAHAAGYALRANLPHTFDEGTFNRGHAMTKIFPKLMMALAVAAACNAHAQSCAERQRGKLPQPPFRVAGPGGQPKSAELTLVFHDRAKGDLHHHYSWRDLRRAVPAVGGQAGLLRPQE